MKGDKNATDYTYYGKALLGAKKFQEAIAQFEKAMEVDNKAVEPLAKISEAYTGLNNPDKALEYSELYMQKNPNATPSDYAKMAQIYVEKKDFSKALGIYDKMAEKFPQITGWTYMIASSVADKSGNTELGAAYNQKIIDMLGNKADRDEDETGYLKQALRLIGYYYWSEKNDLEKAKPYYEMLIKIDPNDGNAKAALGIE